MRGPDMSLPAPSLPCLDSRGHIFLSYPASSWRARCLFSRTNIFSRLQRLASGTWLLPGRSSRAVISGVVKRRPLADTECRPRAVT